MLFNIAAVAAFAALFERSRAAPHMHARQDVITSEIQLGATLNATSTESVQMAAAEATLMPSTSTDDLSIPATSTLSALTVESTPVFTNNVCNQYNAKFKILDSYASKHSFIGNYGGHVSSNMVLEATNSTQTDPTEEEHYTEEDSIAINSILGTLQDRSSLLLPQLNLLVANGQANVETLAGPISDLNNAILAASASLQALSLQPHNGTTMTKRRLTARQLEERGLLTPGELASTLAGIVGNITNTLETLSPLLSSIPILGPLLAGLDATLATTLTSLVPVVGGVLNLVGPILAPVGGLLNGLGLGLIASLLGI